MAKLDLEQINLARKLNGQELLTELPKEGEEQSVNKTAEEIEAAKQEGIRIEAEKKLKEEADKKKLDEGNNSGEDDMPDEKIIELLEKRGIKLGSLDEIKPKEDAEKIAEEKEAAKLTFGLSKGKYTKKVYDAFSSDQKDPQQLVFRQFHAEAKTGDPDLTDEQIQEQFADKYGISADESSWLHKRGQKEISLLADAILKEKYSSVYSANDEFDRYEVSTKTEAADRKKITAGTPGYLREVDKIFTDLKKIPAKFADDEVYEAEAVEDSLVEIKKSMSSPEFIAKYVKAGTKPEELRDIAFTTLLRKDFPAISMSIAKQYLLKHQAGTSGVILPKGGKKDDENFVDESKLPESAQLYRAQHKKTAS